MNDASGIRSYGNRATRVPSTVAFACPGESVRGEVTLHCQGERGHTGRCFYHRKGGQGGTTLYWWGVNPKPEGDLSEFGHADLLSEVNRLRRVLVEIKPLTFPAVSLERANERLHEIWQLADTDVKGK